MYELGIPEYWLHVGFAFLFGWIGGRIWELDKGIRKLIRARRGRG